MKAILILTASDIVILFIAYLTINHKAKKQIKEWERKYNVLKTQINKNNEAKESMETGNGVNDFNASINVLSHLKK